MDERIPNNEKEEESIVPLGFLKAIVVIIVICVGLLCVKAYSTKQEENDAINTALFNLNESSRSQDGTPEGWKAIGYDNNGTPIKWVDESGMVWSSGKNLEEMERIEKLSNSLSPFHKSSYTNTDDDGYEIQFNVTISR